MATHEYGIWLGAQDPVAPQPDKIDVELKPHQRAALAKAMRMERTGELHYHVPDPQQHLMESYARRYTNYRGRFAVKSNVGVLGDMVGYGKTLTALSIIAATQGDDLYNNPQNVYSFHSHNHAYFTAMCDREAEVPYERFIRSTLVVVPRGPVFVQWEHAIKTQTKLKAIIIEGLPCIRRLLPPSTATGAEVKAFFDQFDLVLIKSTTLKTLMDYYIQPEHPIQAWDRLMIDEAHDIIYKIPIFGFRFIWLITATYRALLTRGGYGGRGQLAYAVRDILVEDRLSLLLVRGDTAFVTSSFSVPPPVEHSYLCEMPARFAAVHGFLSPSVQERINANDIQGAIRELGGHHETETDIVDLVTRDLERDIANKQREIGFQSQLDITEDARATRLNTLNTELKRLQDRMESLRERVSALSNKACPICYESYTNPIMLSCTHIFCGQCLMGWMRSGHVCPECRAPIQSRRLVSIVKSEDARRLDAMDASTSTSQRILSKEDTLIKIIRDKPNGKFLVFSRCDSTFYRLQERLILEEISYEELKGSTPTMMKILERFRNGQCKVIMLNTYHAGSGIDISFATDVVLFHSMGLDGVQAIGRAQRVGRTTTLHVHHLVYANELNEPEPPQR